VGPSTEAQNETVSRAPRVVLDTNVVLSALVFAEGRSAALRNAWQSDRCRGLVSRATVDELVRVLAYPKFGLTADEQHELLADYLPYCTIVRMPRTPPVTPVCRDPFDLVFLQLAIAGKAEYLVTGDGDLLALVDRVSCSIVTVEQWLRMLENR